MNMPNVLQLKKLISAALFHTKLLDGFSYLRDRRAIILAYHRVLPEDSPYISHIQPGMYVSTRTFEQHMVYLANHFQVLSLSELPGTENLQNKCFITFDDGWQDNYTQAFPILRKYGLPATIFLTTGFVGSGHWHWPDRISYYLYAASAEQLTALTDIVRKYRPDEKIDLVTTGKYEKTYTLSEKVIAMIKKMADEQVQRFMEDTDRLMSECQSYFAANRPWLNWDEITEMSQNRISFGAHTHNHIILTQIPAEQAKNEIAQSINIIAGRLHKKVSMFSYPNGNTNQAIVRFLTEEGFDLAVTTRKKKVSSADDYLLLPRISVHDDITNTLPMFAARISGSLPYF
jgi:peptidoglycan/xylan/chitin deacetylase (PgdA/CDA1 family)